MSNINAAVVISSLFVSSCVFLAATQPTDGGDQCSAIPQNGVPAHVMLKLLAEESFSKIGENMAQLEIRLMNAVCI